MKNAMQLKAKIKNISKETGISAQLVLQNYMLERLLERIAVSSYRDKFILKGGFLIASIVGLDTRATMDMDVTIKGLPLNEEQLDKIFKEICSIDVDDPFEFEIKKINEIREGDTYTGFRVSVLGKYPPMAVPLKLDITTGDEITPKEISFVYKMIFDEGNINVLAYNLETILAEKLETIISRGDQNTRPRDFYDIYILSKLKQDQINYEILKEAIEATSKRRNTNEILEDFEPIIDVIMGSEQMKEYWYKYQKEFDYAHGISFDEVVTSTLEMLRKIIN